LGDDVAVVGLGDVDLLDVDRLDPLLLECLQHGVLERGDEVDVDDDHARRLEAQVLGVVAHGRAVELEAGHRWVGQGAAELGRDRQAADDRHALADQELGLGLLPRRRRPADHAEDLLAEEPLAALVGPGGVEGRVAGEEAERPALHAAGGRDLFAVAPAGAARPLAPVPPLVPPPALWPAPPVPVAPVSAGAAADWSPALTPPSGEVAEAAPIWTTCCFGWPSWAASAPPSTSVATTLRVMKTMAIRSRTELLPITGSSPEAFEAS